MDYTIEDWGKFAIQEYAEQAGLVAKDILLINSISQCPRNDGGVFYFHVGRVKERLSFALEDIRVVEV